jgi:hypothetical protein
MADTRGPSGGNRPATLDRDEITARLRAAELIRSDAQRRLVTTPCGPTDPIVRDEAGRTPEGNYHFWCGVTDAYAAMLAQITTREQRS